MFVTKRFERQMQRVVVLDHTYSKLFIFQSLALGTLRDIYEYCEVAMVRTSSTRNPFNDCEELLIPLPTSCSTEKIQKISLSISEFPACSIQPETRTRAFGDSNRVLQFITVFQSLSGRALVRREQLAASVY